MGTVQALHRLDRLREVRAVIPEAVQIYEARPPAQCWVYEVWDTQRRLAYVGIADNFEKRWRQHLRSSWWLGEIDIWYVTVYGYRSRWEARQVEAVVINTQSPVYNTAREYAAYEAYNGIWQDPARRDDDLYCTPVKKRRFVGVN